jgi:putative transposase
LVERAERWQWDGLWRRLEGKHDLPLANWPVRRPANWTERVNRVLKKETLQQLRECVQRGRPWGDAPWVQTTAQRLGLEFTLRNAGRPRKENQ